LPFDIGFIWLAQMLERTWNKPLDPTRLTSAIGHMKLIGKWRILIEGNGEALAVAPWWRKGRDYLLDRLFGGEEIDPKALEYYHITVRSLGEDDEIITIPPEQRDPASFAPQYRERNIHDCCDQANLECEIE
jgi:hypothetical protein